MEMQGMITREALYAHKILRTAVEMYGVEDMNRQVVINRLSPYQPDQGELLIRPMNVAEEDYLCMLHGLSEHIGDARHNVITLNYFALMMPIFQNSLTLFISSELEQNAKFIGWRRYDNQGWWIHREPTEEERAIETLSKVRH